MDKIFPATPLGTTRPVTHWVQGLLDTREGQHGWSSSSHDVEHDGVAAGGGRAAPTVTGRRVVTVDDQLDGSTSSDSLMHSSSD